MRKQLFIYLSAALFVTNAFGQDAHFTQYFLAPQLINPSSFGVINSFEAGIQYKGQWNSFTKGYTTYAAFANKSFKKEKDINSSKAYMSAGLNVLYDQAGSSQLTHFKVELPVNVTKKLSEFSFLTAGLYLGFGQLAIKKDDFTWGNQFDGYQYNPTFNSNELNRLQTKNYLDAGLGLNFVTLRKVKDLTDISTPKNIVGFSINHLNKPNYSLYNTQALGIRINFHEQYYIDIKNTFYSLVPSIMVQYQSKAYEVIFGTYLRRSFRENAEGKGTKHLSFGAFYRLNDMCALSCLFELNKYTIGLNYDFNVSKLLKSSKSFGGLEITLKMNSPFKYSNNETKAFNGKVL
ncbi:PorP/SprF family type IX secretion system membrane protein [Aurantibacillus circumpalustris]|uniref:PorP/SprF family type IX secretion system membrane protein n=1 Tax=Aurantibacillus circumpalustris TaxID=3036359 RepID=UPI00295B82F5|nr:PorP/SprF family type IX secretion system membrane protein [Aurantibacillus circumpalustris]